MRLTCGLFYLVLTGFGLLSSLTFFYTQDATHSLSMSIYGYHSLSSEQLELLAV